MQYKTSLVIQPHLNRLFEALADRLPVQLDADQIALLQQDLKDITSPATYSLSASGHVVIRAEVEPSETRAASLFFDGNRRNMKVVRQVCEAWTNAFDKGANAPDVSLTIFEGALAEMGSEQ